MSARGTDMVTSKSPVEAVVKESVPAGGVPKKPYCRPLLTTYGHISKLTMGLAGSGTDGGAGKMMKNCL